MLEELMAQQESAFHKSSLVGVLDTRAVDQLTEAIPLTKQYRTTREESRLIAIQGEGKCRASASRKASPVVCGYCTRCDLARSAIALRCQPHCWSVRFSALLCLTSTLSSIVPSQP